MAIAPGASDGSGRHPKTRAPDGFRVRAASRIRGGDPGPERPHKSGAFERDIVHIQLHGGLFVARAAVKICWIGEYSRIDEIRRRTEGSLIHELEAFWQGRPRVGYAAVAELTGERWLPAPFWAGPRTYGYEWVVLDDDAKRRSWLEEKEPPRGGEGLKADFDAWLRAR